MITGRKPKARTLKILHHSQPRRTWNVHEPSHPPIDPEMPVELQDDRVAQDEWQRLIGTLSANGHLTTVDRAAFLGYCKTFSRWQQCEREAAKAPILVRGAKRAPMANPAISLANRTLVLMLRAASELGITPCSRARIVAIPPTIPSPDGDDEFSRFQRRRR